MASNFVKGSLTEMQIQISVKECSMCGDVGIEKELFQCERCLYRLQHRYCSRLYGHGELKELTCDWCLHEQESSCRRVRDTRQMKTAQYISGEVPADLKPSSDNEKGKGRRSGHNVECYNEPPAATAINNSESRPQNSSEKKTKVGEKDKIIKQRYRYRSLAKLLQ